MGSRERLVCTAIDCRSHRPIQALLCQPSLDVAVTTSSGLSLPAYARKRGRSEVALLIEAEVRSWSCWRVTA